MQLRISRLLYITLLISVVNTQHPNVHYVQAGFSVPFPVTTCGLIFQSGSPYTPCCHTHISGDGTMLNLNFLISWQFYHTAWNQKVPESRTRVSTSDVSRPWLTTLIAYSLGGMGSQTTSTFGKPPQSSHLGRQLGSSEPTQSPALCTASQLLGPAWGTGLSCHQTTVDQHEGYGELGILAKANSH